MFENFFAKRRARKIFGKMVSQDDVDKILNGEIGDVHRVKPDRIEFVFILLRDTGTPEELSKQIKEVTNKCRDFSATVFNICGPMVIVAFCGARPVADASTKRLALAGQLHLQLSDQIKVVHGTAEGHQGLLGGDGFCSYTFTFPGFAKAIAELTQLDFGEMSEFKSK